LADRHAFAVIIEETMPAYTTIDYLPDLTSAEMRKANTLSFSKYTQTEVITDWDNSVTYYTSKPGAILHSLFAWEGTAGATYDISSSSFFDPFLIQVYDNLGNVVAVDGEDRTYGSDYVWDFVAPYTGTYYVSAGWDQGAYHTFVSLSIYEDVDTIPVWTTQYGTSGNDSLLAMPYTEFHGAEGLDTLTFAGARAEYAIQNIDDHTVVTKTTGQLLTAFDIERFIFTDFIVSFETTGSAATAYRLYQAAFDRAPDAHGLGYWVSAIDRGISLGSVAEMFISSTEFASIYGISASPSDIIAGLYGNVLNRPADVDGLNFWLDAVNNKHVPLADILVAFSESAENQAQLIGALQSGYEFSY
jgi:hypothetical protein